MGIQGDDFGWGIGDLDLSRITRITRIEVSYKTSRTVSCFQIINNVLRGLMGGKRLSQITLAARMN